MSVFRIGLDRGFLTAEGKLAWGDIGLGGLGGATGVVSEYLPTTVPELTPAHVAAYQGFVLGGTAVTRASLANGAENLIVLCRAGVGYDRIDVPAITEADIALCTTPAASKHAVASASFAYIIALAKRMIDKDRLVREGRWDARSRGQFCGNEIYGRTLGIVGFGNTGSELARLVAPFAMRVLASDPYTSADAARAAGVTLVPLDDLFREADFVCIHAHLSAETRGIVGARQFGLMKPSAYFINCARGPIADEHALIEALRARRIAGAGLDVFEEEPLQDDNPLIEMDNVMLSPHTMAHTLELSIAMGEINTRQLLACARGENPESVVNRAVLDRPGFQAKLSRWRRAG